MMFTNAKVGDSVYSKYYGVGVISNIDTKANYPVFVKYVGGDYLV
jgi:hypothetical protein